VISRAPVVLICDEDRVHSDALAYGLDERGYAIEIARSFADAFAAACRFDVKALVAGAQLRDGSTLALPAALGIRRPRLVVLATRMGERVAAPIARRVGFDLQLTKVVDPRAVARLIAGRAAGDLARSREGVEKYF
jgi:ActR/RegA family two-component response regulator